MDEEALIDALKEAKLGGAGLDVFASEPNVPEELKSMPNVVLQPHHASGTIETRSAMGDLVARNLEAHFAGKPLLTAETGNNTQSRSDQPLLRFERVVKQFGGTLAVDDVTLDLFSHEVLALVGGNGAGKSTLVKMLAGVHAPTSGQIFFRGRPVSHFGGKPPIAFIHQDLGLIEWMTVAENLALGLGFPRRGGLIQWRTSSTGGESFRPCGRRYLAERPHPPACENGPFPRRHCPGFGSER